MPKSKGRGRSRTKRGTFGVIKTPNGTYRAYIHVDGKTKNLGTYATSKQAAKVYDKEAIELRVLLCKLNYPKTAPPGYTPILKALHSNNTVGYRGVVKNRMKFKARVAIANGKYDCLGTYDTAKEAAVAYDRAVHKQNKSKSLLNFPDMVHNLDIEPKRKKLKVHSNNTSGYRGVTKRASGRFNTGIRINGKKTSLGMFDTAIEAALAYDQAAIKNGNKSHTLNFPDGFPIHVANDVEESTAFFV